MIKAIVFDFCRVFLFPKKEDYYGELNSLHGQLSKDLNYNFSDHFVFNHELIEFIKENNIDINFSLHIFTSGNIQETPECQRFMNGYFKKIFAATKLNLSKKEISTYLFLADELNLNPGEILFVDDNRGNTSTAELAGLNTITFRNNIQFETEIEGYILDNNKI
jgi:FMN phosphatase YigB (HAD superfamily)